MKRLLVFLAGVIFFEVANISDLRAQTVGVSLAEELAVCFPLYAVPLGFPGVDSNQREAILKDVGILRTAFVRESDRDAKQLGISKREFLEKLEGTGGERALSLIKSADRIGAMENGEKDLLGDQLQLCRRLLESEKEKM